MCKIESYKNDNLQHPSEFLISLLKNESLLSATTLLFQRPSLMTYNTTASMDKLTWNDVVSFIKCQDRCDPFSSSRNDSNYFDLMFHFFKKVENREFRVVQKLTNADADFNQIMPIWGIGWSFQWDALLERNTFLQRWYQQCPKTWVNNSK